MLFNFANVLLFLIGGFALSNIMFAFVVGVVVGTFSSVFVASAFVLDIGRVLGREGLREEAV